jgi:hypothetical protein
MPTSVRDGEVFKRQLLSGTERVLNATSVWEGGGFDAKSRQGKRCFTMPTPVRDGEGFKCHRLSGTEKFLNANFCQGRRRF